jgi:hypothetical protein
MGFTALKAMRLLREKRNAKSTNRTTGTITALCKGFGPGIEQIKLLPGF